VPNACPEIRGSRDRIDLSHDATTVCENKRAFRCRLRSPRLHWRAARTHRGAVSQTDPVHEEGDLMPCCLDSRPRASVFECLARAARLGAWAAAWAMSSTAGADTAWNRIATEWQPFTVSGTQTVRYGSGTSWVTKSVTGSAYCMNEFFGTDPAYGIVKQCEVAVADDGTVWTRIATEWQPFSVSGTQMVRYGSGDSWVTKPVTGDAYCMNDFFGTDPAYGILKQCEVAAQGTTPPPVAAQACTPPFGPAGTAGVAPSVGDGTPQSCTEAALRAAVAWQSVVTFNCGAGPVTIGIESTIELPTDRSIVVDGGNRVTLDGLGRTRIFRAVREDYRTNDNTITLQHITLANGKANGTSYVPPNPANPSCAYGWADGQGGGILVRDVRLRAIDTTFRNNAAATPGPDVGGGAIYVMGSRETTVIGSTFIGNSGANGGAVGLLQTDGSFYNDVFQSNVASGTGQNFQGGAASGCPGLGQPDQGGAGGNGGAVSIDGADDADARVCGSTFVGNRANELGGALFRTINGWPRRTTIERSRFQANTARQAAGVFVSNANPLEVVATTFDANVASGGAGAAHFHGSRVVIENSTFSANQASLGLGGALFLSGTGPDGFVRNATFVGNLSSGGPGYFSAAVAGSLNFPVYNSVFANNLTGDGGSPMQCSFTIGSGADDVQWPPNHALGGAPDSPCVWGIVFTDPQLTPLADNGGPTPTAAPLPTSPLRGAGRNCPATDQRGVPRNTSQCTIGAME
jgi:hypothetical protein